MYLISPTNGTMIAILLGLFLDSTLSDQVVVQREEACRRKSAYHTGVLIGCSASYYAA
jgi:hypothetical protein